MTLNDVFTSALMLMGYPYSPEIAAEYPFITDKFTLCNRVFTDLGLKNEWDPSATLKFSEDELDTIIYGVAMFIALYMGDGLKHGMLTDIYNARRRKVKSAIGRIRNVMP